MPRIKEYAYLEVRAIKELSSFLIVLMLLVLVGCSATNTPATTTTTLTITSTTTTAPTTTTLYSGLYYASSASNTFHYDWCYYVDAILSVDLVTYTNREWALAAGKFPCSYCKP